MSGENKGTPLMTETIQLEIQAPQKTGLQGLLADLDLVRARVAEVNKELNAVERKGLSPDVHKSQKALEADIKGMRSATALGKPMDLTVKDAAAAYGHDLNNLRAYLRQRKSLIGDDMRSWEAGRFSSEKAMARQIKSYHQHLVKEYERDQVSLAKLMTPPVPPAAAPPPAAPVRVAATPAPPAAKYPEAAQALTAARAVQASKRPKSAQQVADYIKQVHGTEVILHKPSGGRGEGIRYQEIFAKEDINRRMTLPEDFKKKTMAELGEMFPKAPAAPAPSAVKPPVHPPGRCPDRSSAGTRSSP